MRNVIAIRLLLSIFFAIAIGFSAGHQILGVSRDYNNYLLFFDLVRSASDYFDIQYRFEPGFTAVVYWLVNAGLDNYLVYSIIAASIVFVKYIAIDADYIEAYAATIFIFTFYFLSRYVVLFEMTVLRGACAFSLAFLVFLRKNSAGIRWRELLLLLLAVAFHYSAFVLIFIYLIRPANRFVTVLVPLGVFVAIVLMKNVALTYLPNVIPVFATYEEFGRASLLPIPLVLDLAFFALALYHFDEADLVMRYAVLGMGLGFAFHFALIDYSILAARFRELLSVFSLVYVVRVVSCGNERIVRYTVVYTLLAGMINFYVVFFYDPLLS
ncbi:EpsG family protein [Cupriavidus metallidurans]|uniref:EpsG family protein n=1 Tax=Cupriavidus metallidurans TaxID=119219 RepID=UPI003D70C684